MYDLHRAVEAEIDSFRPDRTPPFSAIKDLKRARDRRRDTVSGVALVVIAVAGIAFGSSTLAGSPDRLPSYADPIATPTVGIGGERRSFNVTYVDPAAYERDRDDPLIDKCLALPGVSSPGDPRFTNPPRYALTVTGAEQAQSFANCVSALDNVDIQEPKAAESKRYTVKPSVTTVRNPDLEAERAACLSLPGVESIQLDSDPVQHRATVMGTAEIEAFERCIKDVVGLYIPELVSEAAFIERCVGSEQQRLVPEYVGLTEAEALRTTHALTDPAVNEEPVRIIGRDGECLGRSHDFRQNRVNLIISGGKVIWAVRF